MVKIGLSGFGKSFIAWNLAGAQPAGEVVIYADKRAPYRVWNKSIPVVEEWSKVLEHDPKFVIIDHDESDQFPDVVVVSVAPDQFQIERIASLKQQTNVPLIVVLNGYEREGAPWMFKNFDPNAVIPWDMRQATSIVLGQPLTARDKGFRRYFNPIWEAIVDVAGM